MKKISTIILAAGKSERFNKTSNLDKTSLDETNLDKKNPHKNNVICKLLIPYDGKPLIENSLSAFLTHHLIDKVVLVVNNTEEWGHISHKHPNLIICNGGTRRQDSVKAGLDALTSINPDFVLVHDGARPNVTYDLISNVINELEHHSCVIPGIPVTDTTKEIDEDGYVKKTHNRKTLRAIQTPQGFDYNILCDLISKHSEQYPDHEYTDEAYLFEHYKDNIKGYKIKVVEGSIANKKITYESDLEH